MSGELYRSDCCGVVVCPGDDGNDNVVGVDAGDELVLERRDRAPDGLDTLGFDRPHDRAEQWQRVRRVSKDEARRFDAMREGECPVCGAVGHGLTMVRGFKPGAPADGEGEL